MPKKSIFRQPGAQHFQLVHRSQRDPLINDPDAAAHVFREVGRPNERKTGTISSLEQSLPPSSVPFRPNEGQASLYGVYYDDTSYDYMQHLRGMDEDNVYVAQQARRGKEEEIEAMFVPAPRGGSSAIGNAGASNRTVNKINSYKGKGRALDDGDDDEDSSTLLPSAALPSREELSREQVLENQRAIPSALQGFQPDMNPHLRQVLEALEDEAFVIPAKRGAKSVVSEEVVEQEEEEEVGSGDEEDESWFNELLGSGEKDEEYEDEDDFEFREEGIEDDGRPSWVDPNKVSDARVGVAGPSGTKAVDDSVTQSDDTWADFKRFKASGALSEVKATADLPQDDNDDYRSEAADTITSLPASVSMSVIGGKGKKRRKGQGGSDASGYSMSSSSMFRNKGLTTLDEMFEKVERDYEDDGDDFPEDEDYPSSEIMSSFTGDGDESEAGSTTSFATASTFTRIMRKQQLAQQSKGETEVSREDFEAIMDDFLEKYEVVGKKMVPVLEGASGADKLKSIRRALIGLDLEGGGPSSGLEEEEEEERERKKDAEYIRKRFLREDGGETKAMRAKRDDEEIVKVKIISGDRDRGEAKWDVETVLSTKSNLENHPKLIGAIKKKQPANGNRFAGGIIREEDDFDESEPALEPASSNAHAQEDDDETSSQVSSDGTITTLAPHTTVSRPRDESKEDKKARKAAVKADRGARRVEKKQRQEMFSGERRKMLNKEKKGLEGGRAADLSTAAGVNVVRL